MNVLSDLIQRNSVSKHKQWDTETIGTRRYKQMGRAGLHVKKKKNAMSVTKFWQSLESNKNLN